MEFLKNIKKCFPFFKDCKKELVLLIILGLFNTIFFVINPALIANIVNHITIPSTVIINLLALGLCSILSTAFNILISKYYLKSSTTIISKMRLQMCNAFLNYQLNTYYNYGQGVLINRVNEDTKNMVVDINNIKESILYALKGLGILLYISFLNIYLGIYYILATGISIFVRYIGIQKQLKLKRQLLEKKDKNTTLLGEFLKGLKEIKLLNLKDQFAKKSENSFEEIKQMEFKSTFSYEFYFKIADFLESVFLGIMILFSMLLIQKKYLLVSTFIVIFMYRDSIFIFSSRYAKFVVSTLDFNLSCKRIFSVLDTKEYSQELFGKERLENFDGSIELKNVTFSYNSKIIFQNLNLIIEPHSFVGIIGSSGSGKSTLLQLIAKINVPSSGNIYFGEKEYRCLDEESLHKAVSMMNQSPYLFNMSIRQNLKLVKQNVTEQEMKMVLKDVCLSNFINSLPNGLDTILGEDGVKISRGEAQRIALARCLLLKTPIFLFDEITSNLDQKTSFDILQTIINLKGKYTIVMVAHKLEMISYCDRVLLLGNGKILCDEPPKQLKRNHYYQAFIKKIR